MPRFPALLATAVVAGSTLCTSAYALQQPTPGRADERIRYVAYDPGNVVELWSTPGAVMVIQFADDETVVDVAASDRLRSHEQQKARLAVRKIELKEATRKARIRRLIQAGGLVEKAGLLELDSNALYGALLTIATDASDPDIVARWSALGSKPVKNPQADLAAAAE